MMPPEYRVRLYEMCKRELMAAKLDTKMEYTLEEKEWWIRMEQTYPYSYPCALVEAIDKYVPEFGLHEWAASKAGVINKIRERINEDNYSKEQNAAQRIKQRAAAARGAREETGS